MTAQKLTWLYQQTWPHQAERLRNAPAAAITVLLAQCAEPANCHCAGDWAVHGENADAPAPGPRLAVVRNATYVNAIEAALGRPDFFLDGLGGCVLPASEQGV